MPKTREQRSSSTEEPTLNERIAERLGWTVVESDERSCEVCFNMQFFVTHSPERYLCSACEADFEYSVDACVEWLVPTVASWALVHQPESGEVEALIFRRTTKNYPDKARHAIPATAFCLAWLEAMTDGH